MKIVVTYEAADITRLIRQDLARQGITAQDTDIKYSKSSAIVSVEVDPDDMPAEPPTPAAAPPPRAAAPPPPTPTPTPPVVEVIEGGNNPVDMSSVLAMSNKVARTTEGKFPMPKQHARLEGESDEPPNWEKP